MMQLTPEFKNGLTAGIVLAAAHLIREGYDYVAEDILKAAGIDENEDLSFCTDYDLKALREHMPEFADVYGHDAELGDEEPLWTRDDERTIITTLLVCERTTNGIVTPERVAKWTDEECEAVEDYCRAVHINASDNDDYPVPPKPAVLEAV